MYKIIHNRYMDRLKPGKEEGLARMGVWRVEGNLSSRRDTPEQPAG